MMFMCGEKHWIDLLTQTTFITIPAILLCSWRGHRRNTSLAFVGLPAEMSIMNGMQEAEAGRGFGLGIRSEAAIINVQKSGNDVRGDVRIGIQ
jgi:hypothetical protein